MVYYKYRDCLYIKYAHIVYYENSNDPYNQTVLKIMERMCLEYPKVPCQRFIWEQRKMKNIEINIDSASEILCFKDKKQICKVNAFCVRKLETLFKTVYNDCVENSLCTFNRFLISKGLMKIGEEHVKYVVEHPSYVIPINNRSCIFEYNSLSSCQFKSVQTKRHMEIQESKNKDLNDIPGTKTKRKKKRELSENYTGDNHIQKRSNTHKKMSNQHKTLNFKHDGLVSSYLRRKMSEIPTFPHSTTCHNKEFENVRFLSQLSTISVNNQSSNFNSCMFASSYPINKSNIINDNLLFNTNNFTTHFPTNNEIGLPKIPQSTQIINPGTNDL